MKKALTPQFFTKHILPSFILLNHNPLETLDLKTHEELNATREDFNRYQKVVESNSIKIFQLRKNKNVHTPDLYILKSDLNHFQSIVNALPSNHVDTLNRLHKDRERLELLERSVPAIQKKTHTEYQGLFNKLMKLHQAGARLIDYLNEKHYVNDNYRKVKKNKSQKLKKQKDKEILKEWEAKLEQYHDLFPVARRMRRKVKLFIGPTNSGKTYNALNELVKHQKGVYLAPLRLLALEGKEELESRGFPCSFITGEEKEIVEGAQFIAQTIETFNYNKRVNAVLIDEVQMIADENRGWAWTQALIGAPADHIVLTGSLDCREIITHVCELLGDELEIVDLNRFTNLEITELPEDIAGDKIKELETSTALIVFSRKSALKFKYYFEKADLPVSIIYGNLSPEVRREEARKFRTGETKYLISTDAISMGLNLPIKKVVFGEVIKFNGKEVDFIQPNEVRQIAGRAGRYGKFDVGYVSALSPNDLNFIRKAITVPNKISNILYVRPSLEQVLLLSQLLDTSDLYIIFDKFYKLIQKQDDLYKSADLDQIKDLAQILDKYRLTLEEKYFWASLPMDISTPETLNIFNSWVKAFADKKPIRLNLPFVIPESSSKVFDQELLLKAEVNIKVLTAYAWLANHNSNVAPDVEKCKGLKKKMNDYIIECLNSKIAEKRCPDCNAKLDIETNHRLCDECFFSKRAIKPNRFARNRRNLG